MRDPFDTRKRRSVSQLKEYERCPYSWYLSRVVKAWQRPAAWLVQGGAVHSAIEFWEKSGRTASLEETREVFRQEYEREANELLAITPNMEWWFASGPHGGEADLIRRFAIGLDQVAKYFAWANNHPEEVIWITPDGKPAIELEFDMELDGVLIRGFIDAIVIVDGELRVRDHKTGNSPGDDFQLGVYGVALGERFGVLATRGDYWMARNGGPTYPFDLRDWTKETVGRKFRQLEDNIAAGRFDALPSPDKCRFCSVAHACEYAQ